MIRLLPPERYGALLRRARRVPAIGPRLWVDATLKKQNPALPWQFYRAGRGAFLQHTGAGAYLCGPMRDTEELAAFLRQMGVTAITTDGAVPAGWRAEALCVMAWQGSGEALPAPQGLEEAPSPAEVCQLLQGQHTTSEAARQFYTALCTRINHGYARLLGVRQGGALASTAGAYCLAPWEAYLSGVHTLPAARGSGTAAALVSLLCQSYKDRRVTLVCRPQLKPYYQKLGFEQCADAVGARPAAQDLAAEHPARPARKETKETPPHD